MDYYVAKCLAYFAPRRISAIKFQIKNLKLSVFRFSHNDKTLKQNPQSRVPLDEEEKSNSPDNGITKHSKQHKSYSKSTKCIPEHFIGIV